MVEFDRPPSRLIVTPDGKGRCNIALGTFIAGRSSASIDPPGATAATDLGYCESGYQISVRHGKELINEADATGVMAIDAIYRGISDCFVQFTCMEYKAGPLLAAFPYAVLAPTGNSYLGPGVIGRLDTAVAGVLVLTATSSTPAASAPATLTADLAVIAEGHDVAFAINSKLRRLPIKMRIYPADDAGTLKFWETT